MMLAKNRLPQGYLGIMNNHVLANIRPYPNFAHNVDKDSGRKLKDFVASVDINDFLKFSEYEIFLMII